MELKNKIIFYKKYIYKVVKEDEKHCYINKLKVDNTLEIEYDFNKIINFPNIKMLHFEDTIDDEKKETKIKKYQLKNVQIIENVNNYYLSNGELKDNYINLWANFIDAYNFETLMTVKYYIFLLTNGKFKKMFKEQRELELYIFCILMCHGPPPKKGIIPYIDIIKQLGYEKIFITLREEAMKIEMLNFKCVENECCPACLSSDVKNYVGLYKCSHHICFDCYIDWTIKTCPICRSN